MQTSKASLIIEKAWFGALDKVTLGFRVLDQGFGFRV
jgi:hypothetical protein